MATWYAMATSHVLMLIKVKSKENEKEKRERKISSIETVSYVKYSRACLFVRIVSFSYSVLLATI
jgi:hypothetical protein